MSTEPARSTRRVLVVSPHLDDAVFSLGATIHNMVASGLAVDLVTVFAGNPERSGPPSHWDGARNVATAVEATAQRRDEDRTAAAVVGATPHWLPFDDQAYLAARDPEVVLAALQPYLDGAEAVFLAGWPLSHPDHEWCSQLVLERYVGDAPLIFYAEWPYSRRVLQLVKVLIRGRNLALVGHHLDAPLCWHRPHLTAADRQARHDAISAYALEISRLGKTARLGVVLNRIVSPELIAWSGPPGFRWGRQPW